jgi:hypothetical protein
MPELSTPSQFGKSGRFKGSGPNEPLQMTGQAMNASARLTPPRTRECQQPERCPRHLGELLDSTSQYYGVMAAFATDVDTWLEEQVRQVP